MGLVLSWMLYFFLALRSIANSLEDNAHRCSISRRYWTAAYVKTLDSSTFFGFTQEGVGFTVGFVMRVRGNFPTSSGAP